MTPWEWIFLVIALHETGHILTSWALGVKVHSIGLNWKGLYNRRERGTLEQNVLISLAGPGLNILLGLLFWHTSFGLLNLVFGIVNLLPIRGSDGWRVRHALSQDAVMRRILG